MPLTRMVNGRAVEMTVEEEAAFLADRQADAARRSAAVPASVTPLQMRRALRQLGLFAAMRSAVLAASDDVQDVFEYAAAFERSDPMWNALAAAMTPPRTPAQIDALFRLAATK